MWKILVDVWECKSNPKGLRIGCRDKFWRFITKNANYEDEYDFVIDSWVMFDMILWDYLSQCSYEKFVEYIDKNVVR